MTPFGTKPTSGDSSNTFGISHVITVTDARSEVAGDPEKLHGFNAAFKNGPCLQGASPSMRTTASWLGFHNPPNTRL
jgi:hypothetical protein